MIPTDPITIDRASPDAYVRHIDGDLLSSAIARSDVIRHERLRRHVRGGGAMRWHFKQPNLAFLRPGPAYIASELVVDGVAHRSGPSDQDTVTIVPPNVEVEGVFEMPDQADAIAEYSIVFVSNAFLHRCVGLNIDRPVLSQQNRPLANLLVQLESEAANRDNLFDLYAEGWACQALVQTARYLDGGQSARQPARGGMSRSIVRRIDDYIATHLESELRLADLAEVAQLSKHHFLRAFRQTTGETPHQHVLNMRVKEAKRRLAESAAGITEIALACGFSNSQNFSTIFRKMTGLTPSTFRQQSRR